jgi:hypothetical protein
MRGQTGRTPIIRLACDVSLSPVFWRDATIAEMLGFAGNFRSGCLGRGAKLDLGERFFLVGEDGVGQTRKFDIQSAWRLAQDVQFPRDANPVLCEEKGPTSLGSSPTLLLINSDTLILRGWPKVSKIAARARP